MARVALWGGSRLGVGWYPRLERFSQMDDSESSSSGRGTSESFTPYVLRSIAVSPQPGWFEELATLEAAGVNGCQGAPWSEELVGKELYGALGSECDLGPRGFVFPTHRQHRVNPPSIIFKCGIMQIRKGWCFY